MRATGLTLTTSPVWRLCCTTHIYETHIFPFSQQQQKNKAWDFVSPGPGTSEADRVTEWTFLSTWQLPKWQIDQIFSSVSKTKIFPLLTRAHFLCLNAKIAKRTIAFKSPFHCKDAGCNMLDECLPAKSWNGEQYKSFTIKGSRVFNCPGPYSYLN